MGVQKGRLGGPCGRAGLDLWGERVPGPPLRVEGVRVLLERSLPVRATAGVVRPDVWAAALAPSVALRRWHAAHPDRFEDFARSYERELERPAAVAALWRLRAAAEAGPLILQVADREVERSHAEVVARRLKTMRGAGPGPDGADAACWLRQVCEECGRIPDGPGPEHCPLERAG